MFCATPQKQFPLNHLLGYNWCSMFLSSLFLRKLLCELARDFSIMLIRNCACKAKIWLYLPLLEVDVLALLLLNIDITVIPTACNQCQLINVLCRYV